jgi:hypothetical protein
MKAGRQTWSTLQLAALACRCRCACAMLCCVVLCTVCGAMGFEGAVVRVHVKGVLASDRSCMCSALLLRQVRALGQCTCDVVI